MTEQNEKTHSEISMDEFDLTLVSEMSIKDAKKEIDKHFIILSNGDHAMLNKGKITIYDTKTLNSLYFNRLNPELKNYYNKEKKDIRTLICDIHKPFLTKGELNISEKLKHKYVKYDTFSEKVRESVDCMIQYIKEVLCANREDILTHLLKMMAKMVRGLKNDACIYLKGPQGIGKSTLPEFLRFHVMGTGLSIESGSGPLKNKFNSELKGKVMTIFEELDNFGSAEWMGISSTLKRWITSLTMQIEGKNKDVIEVINIMTFWLLSNNDAIQDDDGRRYFILPVSVKYMEDLQYYGALRDKCFNDEVGHAFYCKLMEIDLTGFNSQRYPLTAAKLDSFAKRLDNVYRFIKDMYVLQRRDITKVTVNDLFVLYQDYCKNMSYKAKNKVDFNKTLEECCIEKKKSDKIHYYSITYKELQAIADKKHWVHDLDTYEDQTKNKKKVGVREEDYSYGIKKEDFSVDINAEWKKKYAKLEAMCAEVEAKYNTLLQSQNTTKAEPEPEEKPKKVKKTKVQKNEENNGVEFFEKILEKKKIIS